MLSTRNEIFVYASWIGIEEPKLIGRLYSDVVRGKEIFSFEYSKNWLNSRFAQVIDPHLQLYPGKQYTSNNNFGMFLDSSPDRWGRVIIQRREAILARIEKRAVKTLMESDYLLEVYDKNRMGALRFKREEDGPFLNQDEKLAAPPWTSISELQEASFNFEQEEADNNTEHLKWLNMLIAPGSSLGGARPKASIMDKKGNLWIAKFPSINDTKDVGGWEMVVSTLASECGLNFPETKIEKFSNRYNTFLVKRFDRKKDERIHFASAMTMLGYVDGADYQAGVSYLELAEFLINNGSNVNDDLKELWKRIVFSISVSNTDDHLRNHGFILTPRGWILSPAFDVNPNEMGSGLSLNISEKDNSLDYDLAVEVAEDFRLTKDEAKKQIDNIKNKVSSWKVIAERYSIPRTEQIRMEQAFRYK